MMHTISILDGNSVDERATARGQKHKCDFYCIRNPTLDCEKYDEGVYQTYKTESIERAKSLFDIFYPKLYQLQGDELTQFWSSRDVLAQEGLLPYQQPKKHRGYGLGAREFTLTYSPKWCTDEEAQTMMRLAIKKLIKYNEGNILKLRAVGEIGKNGLSHVHCYYKLENGLKITDKNFKRAWKYWNPKKIIGNGFEGGHHANVKEESDFLGYIDKDVDTAWLDVEWPAPLLEENPSNHNI